MIKHGSGIMKCQMRGLVCLIIGLRKGVIGEEIDAIEDGEYIRFGNC